LNGDGVVRVLLVVIGLLVLLCASAFADGMADANAGMEALDAGDYASAIASFSRAISKGKLSHDDLELAYVKRAQALVEVLKIDQARSDLNQAQKLSPNDLDISALRPWTRVAHPTKPVSPIVSTHTLPPYPAASMATGEEGRSTLWVLLDRDGNAIDVHLRSSSGSARLDDAAIEYVKNNWKWEPLAIAPGFNAIWAVNVDWSLKSGSN
jgi:TonB family protein